MSPTTSTLWLHTVRSSEAFIVTVISIAMFTDILIYTMIIPIIPKALVSRAGVRQQDAQYWVSILLAVYAIALLVGSTFFGYISDRHRSRRPLFIVGLLALAMSTGLFAAAHSPATLVIARAFQGLSGAAVWVVGLALIVDTVLEERIGQAMGTITVGMTVGGFLGPTVGGVMYEKLGYNGTFVLPTALIILDIILRFSIIEKSAATKHQVGDVENDRDTLASQKRFPKTSEESPLLTSSSPYHSKKKPTALFLLRSTRLLVALLITGMISIVTTAFETTLPLFVMKNFGWSPSGAGLIFLSFSVPGLTGSYVGKLVDRFGACRLAPITFVVAGLTMVSLRFVHGDSLEDKILLVGLLVIIGLGILTLQIVTMTQIFKAIGELEAQSPHLFAGQSSTAQAYALFLMAFAIGQFLGPILAGFLNVHAGWDVMTMAFGITWVLAAFPVACFLIPPSHVHHAQVTDRGEW